MNIEEKEWQGKKKYVTNDKFSVKSIGYDENRHIIQLTIVNEKTHKVAYSFGNAPIAKTTETKREPYKLTCDICSKVIVGYRNNRGRDVPPEELIKQTKMKFGKQMCLECARAESAKEKENNDG